MAELRDTRVNIKLTTPREVAIYRKIKVLAAEQGVSLKSFVLRSWEQLLKESRSHRDR